MGIPLHRVSCLKCATNLAEGQEAPTFQLELNDTQTFERDCPNGHKVTIVIQNLKHELLFEIAMRALCNGDTRGAVFNAASALESFYMFFIAVAFRSLNLQADPAQLRSAWLHRSEQQAGGFAVAYSLLFGDAPPAAIIGRAKFRNDVVHAGLVPTQEQADQYVEAVYDVIVPLVDRLRALDDDKLDEEVAKQGVRARRAALVVSPLMTLLGTVICCNVIHTPSHSFAQARREFETITMKRLQANQLVHLSQLLLGREPD